MAKKSILITDFPYVFTHNKLNIVVLKSSKTTKFKKYRDCDYFGISNF